MIGIYYVYEHWRPDTNQCFYVGKGKKKRAWSLKSRNRHHTSIVSKLTSLGLTVEVRIIIDGLSEETAFMVEKDLIAKYGRDNLTNMTLGGEGPTGRKVSEETKKKLKLIRTGKKPSKETRQKMSAAQGKTWIGRQHSEEAKKKMAEAKKGKQSPRKGVVLSNATKEKIRSANLGKKHSIETRRKMSESTAAWWKNAGN